MTPSGSFSRSKSERSESGSDGCCPVRTCPAPLVWCSGYRGLFLSLRGSIEGGTMYCGTARVPRKVGHGKDRGVVLIDHRAQEVPGPWDWGVETSMWQRQIQRRPISFFLRIRPAGWGSWTTITSPFRSRLPRLASVLAWKWSSISRVISSGCPCSALWKALVILKKAWSPLMTSQVATIPSSPSSGTSRVRISATPPPTAVGVDVLQPLVPDPFGEDGELGDFFPPDDLLVVLQPDGHVSLPGASFPVG